MTQELECLILTLEEAALLRAEIERLKHDLHHYDDLQTAFHNANKFAEEQEAEIGRLLRACKDKTALLKDACAEIERLNGIEATGRKMWHEALAEIERLTTEITETRATCSELRKFDQAEIERLTGILKQINAICYIPSHGRHAYTHFQADFDKIRELTGEWHNL